MLCSRQENEKTRNGSGDYFAFSRFPLASVKESSGTQGTIRLMQLIMLRCFEVMSYHSPGCKLKLFTIALRIARKIASCNVAFRLAIFIVQVVFHILIVYIAADLDKWINV